LKIYLDSCVIIYLEGSDFYSQTVSKAIDNEDDPRFCISDLVRMECRIGPLKRRDVGVLAEFDASFEDLTSLPITRNTFDRAAELCARYRLKTPDAIHLAVALLNGCDEFWTNDGRLATVSGRIKVRILPGPQ